MSFIFPFVSDTLKYRPGSSLDRPDAAAVPIIAMTADAFADEQKRTPESGMNYHISKPIDPSLLYKVLSEYTDR